MHSTFVNNEKCKTYSVYEKMMTMVKWKWLCLVYTAFTIIISPFKSTAGQGPIPFLAHNVPWQVFGLLIPHCLAIRVGLMSSFTTFCNDGIYLLLFPSSPLTTPMGCDPFNIAMKIFNFTFNCFSHYQLSTNLSQRYINHFISNFENS